MRLLHIKVNVVVARVRARSLLFIAGVGREYFIVVGRRILQISFQISALKTALRVRKRLSLRVDLR